MMQTSTPYKKIRKTAFTPNAAGTRSVSVILTPLPEAQCSSNDELERSKRRSHVDLQKRSSKAPSSPLPSLNEIRNHVDTCIQMFTDNKINAKNAWQFKIIDFLSAVFQSHENPKDSFQITTTSLDVSTKIYGIRVDDIHTEGLKLANSVGRIKVDSNKDDDDDEDGDSDEEKRNEGKGRAKKKKKSKVKVNTLRNNENFLEKIQKLQSTIFHTTANVTSNTADNLLSNQIPLHSSGYKFALLNQEPFWVSTHQLEEPSRNFEQIENDIVVPSADNLQICVPFADFKIDEWDMERENELINRNTAGFNSEVVYDANGIPIPELDGSMHDPFDNFDTEPNLGADDQEEVIAAKEENRGNEIVQLVDFEPQLNSNWTFSEYSFVNKLNNNTNKFITNMWAGPSHWKLKHIHRAGSVFSGNKHKQARKVARKQKPDNSFVNFLDDGEPLCKTKENQKSPHRIVYDANSVTLPPYENFYKTFEFLNSKAVKPVSAEAKEEQNVAVPDDDEDPNDSQFCVQDMGDDHQAGDNSIEHEEVFVHAEQNFLGNNLVDAPVMVDQIYIPYALQAKKMDMKKLKTEVWKTLVSRNPKEIVPDAEMYKKEVKPTKFSEICALLPSLLNDKMKENLSPPLIFVALLHLANEQNLCLTQHDDIRDFTVERSKGLSK